MHIQLRNSEFFLNNLLRENVNMQLANRMSWSCYNFLNEKCVSFLKKIICGLKSVIKIVIKIVIKTVIKIVIIIIIK